MPADPYVNLYTSDFLAGTSGMTAATKGVYITLLCLMYEAEEPLSQSWAVLARRCGCTLPSFKKAIAEMQDEAKVTVSDHGIWSEKCDKHIARRRERRAGAKAAADERWKKTQQKQGKGDADAMRKPCQPEPEPEPKRDTNVSLARDAREDEFARFWEIVPRKKGKGAAEKAFAKARKIASLAEIIDGMERYARQREGQDPQYTCHPATWLNQKRWTDEHDHTQADFHLDVEKMLGDRNGIQRTSEINHHEPQQLSAPVPAPDASGHGRQLDRDQDDSRGNQQPHLSLIKPRCFG